MQKNERKTAVSLLIQTEQEAEAIAKKHLQSGAEETQVLGETLALSGPDTDGDYMATFSDYPTLSAFGTTPQLAIRELLVALRGAFDAESKRTEGYAQLIQDLRAENERLARHDADQRAALQEAEGELERLRADLARHVEAANQLGETVRRLREEKEQLRIRVWNRALNVCGGIGSERLADHVAEAFDEPMAPAGSPLSNEARELVRLREALGEACDLLDLAIDTPWVGSDAVHKRHITAAKIRIQGRARTLRAALAGEDV